MNTRFTFILTSITLFALAACSVGVQEPDPVADLQDTRDISVPEGHVPAVIYEIDGARVAPQQSQFALEAGSHTIRVWPAKRVPDPSTGVTDLDPERTGSRLVPVTVVLQAGERYRVAARLVRFRTGLLAGDAGPEEHSPWRTAVIPVVLGEQGEITVAAAETDD